MLVKFWGTRGSLARAMDPNAFINRVNQLADEARNQGIQFLDDFMNALKAKKLHDPPVYGGNTSCTEVSSGKTSVFIDMGTGLREAGTKAISAGRKNFSVFCTHMHWDHVSGLPFFVPIYSPDVTIDIYHVHRNAPEHIKINFNGVNFPIKWEDLPAKINFHQIKLYEPVELDGLKVTAFSLDHPGGSFGYRAEADGHSVVVGVDGEYKRLSRADLGRDLPYYQNLDLLVFDSQYEIHELAFKFDWGHSSPMIGVDLAIRERIRNLVFTHHDPWSDEQKIARMYADARKHLSMQLVNFTDLWTHKPEGPSLFTAYDGLEIDLARLT